MVGTTDGWSIRIRLEFCEAEFAINLYIVYDVSIPNNVESCKTGSSCILLLGDVSSSLLNIND